MYTNRSTYYSITKQMAMERTPNEISRKLTTNLDKISFNVHMLN